MSGSAPTTATEARLFIAAPIPTRVGRRLTAALAYYDTHMQRVVPEEQLHLTFNFLGTVSGYQEIVNNLVADLPQSFVPTITLTHIGPGRALGQLWAWAQPSSSLTQLHLAIQQRVASTLRSTADAATSMKDMPSFIPHVRLAWLRPEAKRLALADQAVQEAFIVRTVHVYRSQLKNKRAQHHMEGAINLMP